MALVMYNGVLVSKDQALVPLCDKSVQLGLSVFETFLANKGRVHGFGLHVKRLKQGLARLRIETSKDIGEEALKTMVLELLAKNDLASKCARVRITMMQGYHLIEVSEAAEPKKVCDVVISRHVLNERSATVGIKCGSYAANMLAMQDEEGGEVIFLNTLGHVAESALANVFIVHDGSLITPSLDSGCLPGVTRELLIQRAQEHGMKVEQRAVLLEELLEADEVFLTNSILGVCGVEHVGEIRISEGLGEMSKKIKEIYHNENS